MTPKEKAKKLVDNYYHLFSVELENTIADYEAKECALMAIEFAREFITGDLNESFDKTMYLFEVKKEIEKL